MEGLSATRFLQVVPCSQLRFQIGVFRYGASVLQCPLNRQQKLVHLERLGDVVESSQFEGLDRRLDGAVGGQHDDRHARLPLMNISKKIHSVGGGHANVGDHEREVFGGEEFLGLLAPKAAMTS